jgi:hypothetical protein
MKLLTTWILALLVIATATSYSGAWTSVQEPPPKQERERKIEKPQAKKLQQKGRAEKHAAIKKVLPTLKTTLVEAVGLAEKETGGKAYSAGLELMDGKASFQVNLFVGEKFTVASVDPETKKVTVAAPKKDGEGGEGDGGGTGGDEEGG